MSRKKKHPEHVNHERWLISYADFITLLFAFFVVLYSSSQVDHRKVGKLAIAIQVAFQELGVFPASGAAVPLQPGDVPPNSVRMLENIEPTAPLGRLISPAAGVLSGATENGDVAALQKVLEKALAPEISRKDIALRHEPDGLVISLREVGFFSSGSAQLRPSAIPALRRIAEILLERLYQIRIEGHTDNIRIHNAQFTSNWELSTARAIEVIRLLISTMGFAPERLSVGGYGEFHPVAPNTTEEGRSLNRRVDVVILRQSILAAASTSPTGARTRSADFPFQEKPTPRTAPDGRNIEPGGKPSPAQRIRR
jgi:chemotaxis protein MotB